MRLFLFSFFLLIFFCGCEKSASEASFKGGAGTGGSLARFTIAGQYLYTVDKETLKVFDIADPSKPVFKRTVPVGFQIETIYPFRDMLFIGSTSMVHIFSIADGAHPKKLSEAISPTVLRRCDPVVAKDTVAYATLRTNDECGGTQSILAVYNIKEITKPVQVATVPVMEPYGLGYTNNTLYVCDAGYGLLVFDITKAFEPKKVKTLLLENTKFIDVIPFGEVLVCWTTNGMTLYDITDQQNPVLIKQIS